MPEPTPAPPRVIPFAGTQADAQRLRDATERFTARRDRDRLPYRIETRRLVLRAPIRGDVPALVTLADNRAIAERRKRLPSPYTRADAIAFVEIFSQRADERPYAITLDGNFIGVAGFSFPHGQDQPPELGYWLGEPHWGKGIMTEAELGLIEAITETGAFREIAARALVDNAASLRVLEKTGFRRIGETTETDEKGRERHLALLRRELRR
jgi:RimJ/RimL family protein N-acetyltransferase